MDKHDQIDCAEQNVADERRRHDRQHTVSLDCSHGIVLDLSMGGMRLVSRKPLVGEVELVLQRGAGPKVRVAATVAWTKRVRFNEHLNGLEFVDGPQDFERRLEGEVKEDARTSQEGS